MNTPPITSAAISNVDVDMPKFDAIVGVPTAYPGFCRSIVPSAPTTVPGWIELIDASVMPILAKQVANDAHCAEFCAGAVTAEPEYGVPAEVTYAAGFTGYNAERFSVDEPEPAPGIIVPSQIAAS